MFHVKEFVFKVNRLVKDDGIIAFNENGDLVSVVFNDQAAAEGLNTFVFVEFLKKIGFVFDREPLLLNVSEYEKVCRFAFDNS